MKLFASALTSYSLISLLAGVTIGDVKLSLADTQPDTYDRIDALIDSIRSWAQDFSQVKPSSLLGSEALPDTLNLMDVFAGAALEVDDSIGVFTITLPTYMDVVNTSLKFTITADSGLSQKLINWLPPIEVKDDRVFLDDVHTSSLSNMIKHNKLLKLLGDRLIQLRTSGLARVVKPHQAENDTLKISIAIRSRDSIKLKIPHFIWKDILSRISAEMLTYAGVLSTAIDSEQVTLKYYMLVTYPQAMGHHFLEWEEKLVRARELWTTETIEVVFTPYIRTDNLRSFFDAAVKP